MKNTILKVWITVAVLLGGSSSLSAAFVSLTNPGISPAPLDSVVDNGIGNIVFGLSETSDSMAPATDAFGEPNIKISVELSKLNLIDNDISLISGTLMNYFSVSYNATDLRLTFTQTADFPGFEGANVVIPVSVTADSVSTDNSLNGFNANISAGDVGTTTDGSASEFTFTNPS